MDVNSDNGQIWHVDRLAFKAGEMRIILGNLPGTRSHVLVLDQIHAYFDLGLVGGTGCTLAISEPGSYAWSMTNEQRGQYRQIMFRTAGNPGVNRFQALAKHAEFRQYQEDTDLNFSE